MVTSGLHMPFPHRISPDLSRARRHGLEWAVRTGMIASNEAATYWSACRFPELACLYWPYATGEDVDLAVDTMTFYFFFDDQFDTDLGHRVENVISVLEQLVDITRGTATALRVPVAVAYADIWRRCIQGMGQGWRDRAAGNWRTYFLGHVGEATDRVRGVVHRMDTYLAVRRCTVGAETSTDLCERLGQFEVPEEILAIPQLRVMRQLSCDILAHSNDLHSFYKERNHGEVNNLIRVTAREHGSTDEEAVTVVREAGGRMMGRFLELDREIPEVIQAVGEAYGDCITRYVDALKAAMRGYDEWGNMTARYRPDITGSTGLSYLEDLTGQRC
ncbi:hypothetical protein [Streptomyces sp. NPDC053560]|uniref:terpene synthase family protein n=1 Tax=Streptomyces sp. NPDC053560 TaxID=3365711 RepID=UPI0037D206E5